MFSSAANAFTAIISSTIMTHSKHVISIVSFTLTVNILVAIISRLFQILLIFGMLGCYNSYNITVQVSDSGVDDPSCMQSGKPCNTLTYALSQISRLSGTLRQSTTVMVNVTCNQTITSSFQYPFTSPRPLSVKVVGHNYAFIKLDQSSTLQVQGFTSEFYWAWIGLGFIRNSSGADITTSYTEILHNFINSLAILDCRIMITEWVIRDTQNLVIDNTEFGRDGFCPILYVSGGSHKTSFIFSNNNISACQHPGIELPILHFRVSKRCSSLTIVNCSFIRLQGDNNFQTAHYATNNNKLPNDREIISVNVTEDVHFEMLVKHCSFIGNSQLILISVNALSKYQYSIGTVFVLLDSINITNNTATSVLVQLKCFLS